MARGNSALAVRARRGLQGLGTAADTARATAAINSLRNAGAARTLAGNTAALNLLNQVLGVASAISGMVEGAVSSAAATEAANAAREGRPVDNTLADVGKVMAWVTWALGGNFPASAAESDLRIFANVWMLAQPAAIAAVMLLGKDLPAPTTTAINAYLARLGQNVQAAVAALPPPAQPVPPPPTPEQVQEVTQTFRANPLLLQNPNLLRNAFRVPNVIISAGRCPAGTTGVPPNCVAEKSTSPILVALPAAAVLWYLFK